MVHKNLKIVKMTAMMSGAMIVCSVAFYFLGASSLGGVRAAGISQDTDFQNKELELIMVHTISRHGDRTPADTYPNDPYINESFHPYGWGTLTNTGRMKMYTIGKLLRKRYNSFLGDIYKEEIFYAQSTGANRARMSASLISAGIWPPRGTDLDWNPDVNWQPIPVVSQELDKDDLLLVRTPCPRYHEAIAEILESSEMRQNFDGMSWLFNDLTKLTGKPMTNLDDIQDVYSTLKAEEGYGVSLPDWTKQYYPDLMYTAMINSYILNTLSNELIRLKGGVLLKKLIKDWNSAAKGTVGSKMNIYGGHDSTVVNLARALGVWDPQEPDYGITLILELFKNRKNERYLVKVNLMNSTDAEPFELEIPECGLYCPLEKVVSLRDDFISKDLESECVSRNPNFVAPPLSGP